MHTAAIHLNRPTYSARTIARATTRYRWPCKAMFRGTPYVQADLRVSRPFTFHDRWSVTPFAEFFNLFNRDNPGANYVTDISALPTPVNNLANATAFCLNPDCTQTRPITSLNQLRAPAGALGDFFGLGATV